MIVGRSLKSRRPQTKATVRRSQLITTYGVGSVLPVESESFMVAGLDEWRPREEDLVDEPRLCASLGVSRLYSPPGGEGAAMVPMVRFPEWVLCPGCARLDKFWRIADKPKEEYVNRCRHCLTVRLVPSRFVACCVAGHIQDFPFHRWAHRGRGGEASAAGHSLRMSTDSGNSTLAGITIICSCGASTTMEGALGRGSLSGRCSGSSPWLDSADEACAEELVALQRGASNVWFAEVRSALTVDRSLSPAEQVLERIRPDLDGLSVEDSNLLLGIMARKHGVEESELRSAYERCSASSAGTGPAMAALRKEEYDALGREHPEVDGTETFVCLPARVPDGAGVDSILDLVSRVPKLREVRVLSGFSRIGVRGAESGKAGGRLSRGRVDWLPAVEVLGEGIFLRIREAALNSWEQSEFARGRADKITEAVRLAAGENSTAVRKIEPRELLLHSFAHALLLEVALDAGYPASSIRERIYAEQGEAGILLYTATADAAGSLGGLCAHGSVPGMKAIIATAAERAQWCSADPVCLESMATGTGAQNLAACHSCLLIPEVSCEVQNRLLDRACLVGTEDYPDSGFLTATGW